MVSWVCYRRCAHITVAGSKSNGKAITDVSVIIAAYNAEQTVSRAIRSALSQTGIDIEVIVVDDASTDQTSAAIGSIGDARLAHIRLPRNGGPGAARNAAIERARSAWVAVLDADDVFLPGRLAKLASAAARYGLDVVADNMWVEAAPGRRSLFIPEVLDGTMRDIGLAGYARRNRLFGPGPADGYLKPMVATDMLRRLALRYDPSTRIGEDFLLVADALAQGARYGRMRSADYIYTSAAGSISHRLKHRDAASMVEADRAFLRRHGARLAAAESSSMRRHLRALLDGEAFIGMVDALKSRRPGAFARSALARPLALRHFAMPIRARLTRATAGGTSPASLVEGPSP